MFKKKDSREKSLEKIAAKFEKKGYSKEMIKNAIKRCPQPIKESSLGDTLKIMEQEAATAAVIKNSSQNLANSLIKKYTDMGFNRDIILRGMKECPNPSNENMMLQTLNALNQETNSRYYDQNYTTFVNNAIKKYGELGYSREIINNALARCSNVYNENAMLDTLNMLTREAAYPKAYPRVMFL